MTQKTEEIKPPFLCEDYLRNSLIAELESMDKKAIFIADIAAQDFLPANHKLVLYEQKLNERNGIVLERKIMSGSKYASVEKLLYDMNYQTILQSRIHNFITINAVLVKELIEMSANTSTCYDRRFLEKISMLCRINYIQLYALTDEYKSVIENLNRALNNLDEFLEMEFGFLDVYYFSNISLVEVISETICKKLKNISEIICPDGHFKDPLVKELEFINEHYSETERKILSKTIEMTLKGDSLKNIHYAIIKE